MREIFARRSGNAPEFSRTPGNGVPRMRDVAMKEATEWVATHHHPEIDVAMMHKYMKIVHAFEGRIETEVVYGEVPDEERRYFLDPGT